MRVGFNYVSHHPGAAVDFKLTLCAFSSGRA
jgi:hypothetical protein